MSIEENEIMVVESSTIALLNKSEIEQQITTAHKFPRSIKRFRDETMQMVTLTEKVAGECIYSLPRGGKTIEGPSARFAEVIASAWGNSRAGARVVSDQGEFVTAQGVFHDLEKNVAITYEVQRRITDKNGKRFAVDMIGVTANAACSIALRNAILKGVPKAFWSDMYDAARATVMGDFKTLANRRADAIKAFQGYGILPEQICATLGVNGIEDIGLESLVTLRGILTAIKDGDTTPEQAFAPTNSPAPEVKMPQSKSEAKAKSKTEPKNTGEETSPKGDDLLKDAAPQTGSDASTEILSASQIQMINAKMEADALGSSDFEKKFGMQLGDMTQDKFQSILDWIKNPAA